MKGDNFSFCSIPDRPRHDALEEVFLAEVKADLKSDAALLIELGVDQHAVLRLVLDAINELGSNVTPQEDVQPPCGDGCSPRRCCLLLSHRDPCQR